MQSCRLSRANQQRAGLSIGPKLGAIWIYLTDNFRHRCGALSNFDYQTEIAKTLGLTKAALYYYVRNKEEVLYECHLMAYDAMDEILRSKHEAETALDKLEILYIDFVNMLTASGVSLLTDVNSLGDENKADVLARRGKIERKIIRLVKDGQKEGSIRAGDARLHVFFFMGALNWLNAWYDASGRLKGEDIAAHFALQMRQGVRNSYG